MQRADQNEAPMRNVQSKTKRAMVRKARGALASWLLTSTAVLGLLATNNDVAQTCTTPPPNMVSWWRGDGNANDIHGSNNGTLKNGPTLTRGQDGKGISIDGVNDHVQVT